MLVEVDKFVELSHILNSRSFSFGHWARWKFLLKLLLRLSNSSIKCSDRRWLFFLDFHSKLLYFRSRRDLTGSLLDWKLHLLQSLFFLLLELVSLFFLFLELVLFEFNLSSLVKSCLMEPLWNKLKRNYLKFIWPFDSLLDKFVGSGAANLLVDSEQGCLALL